jgi:hypothetical protein
LKKEFGKHIYGMENTEQKYCYKCKQTKPKNMFGKHCNKRDGLRDECKKCHIINVKKQTRKKKLWLKEAIQEMKRQNPCCFCGETEPICLDFHHLDEQKEVIISQVIHTCATWKRLETEVAKCVIICANCHRKLHIGLLTLTGKESRPEVIRA